MAVTKAAKAELNAMKCRVVKGADRWARGGLQVEERAEDAQRREHLEADRRSPPTFWTWPIAKPMRF